MRIWLYLRTNTIDAAITALKRWVIYDHAQNRHPKGDREDAAAEDLKHARRLAESGETRSEIEHVLKQHDEDTGER